MSLHPLPSRHTQRGRFPFAILCSLALVGFTSVAAAAEPPASATTGLSDVVLARSALTALDAEPELRGVNLVISVVNGVAVIGGPVPSGAVAKRAEQVVRQVEGMKEVRNTCFVSNGPDPLLKAVAEKAGTQLPPRPVMGELPGVLSTQPPVSPFPQNTSVAAIEVNSTVVARKPSLASPGTGNLLGAPVGPAGSSPPPAIAPTTAPGQLTGATTGELLAAVAEARKTEARFAGLTVELRDGALIVAGSAPLRADAWDFAQKLRLVPGVSRVAVGSVTGK
jgi:BON domain-containing protein